MERNQQLKAYECSRNTVNEYNRLRSVLKSLNTCKSEKEAALTKMREIERENGWESRPYNSSEF
jgi:hypothetical protein